MARVVPMGLARISTGAPSGPSIEETKRTSDIEEDCLALTLQEDVEPELTLGLGHRDERGPPLRRADGAQHRVRGVGGRLLGGIQAAEPAGGHAPPQDP